MIHLHSNQIIYRDLKPENTLVGLDGHVLLGDFGASKRLHLDDGSNAPAERIATGTLVGTPNYMAPEQWGLSYLKMMVMAAAAALVEGGESAVVVRRH